jgi:hypothetical protein
MSTNAPDRIHQGKPWCDGDQSFQDSVVANPDTFVLGHTIAERIESWWKSAVQALDWVEINGLSPGTYSLEFGGRGHAVVDPVTNTTIFNDGWGAAVTDKLIVS